MLGDRDKCQHARLWWFIDKFFKAEEVDGTRGPRIDSGRHAADQADWVGVETVRVHPPVAVNVEVDEPRRDVATAHVQDFFCVLARQLWLNGRDAAIRNAHCQLLAQAWSRIQHGAAGSQQLERVTHQHLL